MKGLSSKITSSSIASTSIFSTSERQLKGSMALFLDTNLVFIFGYLKISANVKQLFTLIIKKTPNRPNVALFRPKNAIFWHLFCSFN